MRCALRNIGVVAGQELRLLSRDVSGLVTFFIGVPLFLVAFIRPGIAILVRSGATPEGGTGADYGIPAFAVLFAFYGITWVGFSLFRDQTLRTWLRLRASSLRPAEVLVGKLVPYAMLVVLQLVGLITAGHFLFGVHLRGSLLAIVAVAVTYAALITSLGLLASAVCRSFQQVSNINHIAVLLLAALGGAMLPLAALPHWVRHVRMVSPQYWALRGIRGGVLGHSGIGVPIESALVLLTLALLSGVAGMTLFWRRERRQSL